MDVFMGLLLFALGVVIYMVPTVVATQRNHRNKGSIVATNVLLGWTGIGWCGALIWALSGNTAPPTPPQRV